jgi:hypothetical protein
MLLPATADLLCCRASISAKRGSEVHNAAGVVEVA